MGVILDIFFDSTAKTLVIYREFWYFSRIFPTLFSQLISIFISILHTLSMGVKTDARLVGATGSPLLCVVAFFSPPAAGPSVLEPLQKCVCHVLSIMSSLTFFNPGAPPIFFNGSHTPALTGGSRKTPLRIMEANRSLLAKSRIDLHSYRECMKEDHEYANELGKQGGKNTTKIPNNHERFSRTIVKNLK